MPAMAMSPQVFVILSGLIEERFGLHYDPADAGLLAEKITPRVQELGFESLLDYYYYLRYDPRGPEELDELAELLVVNETYFFREPSQLKVLVEDVLAPLVGRGKRPRVWCAAAATGEEPLTLAMLLSERGLLDGVDILATDISKRALAQAASGAFGRRSMRALPYGYEKWLTIEGDRGMVRKDLVAAIRWSRVNLLDGGQISGLGRFDVILLRNVLIYFREETARRVVEALAGALDKDGVMAVGVSESLLRFGTLLECEERRGVFLYQRATT